MSLIVARVTSVISSDFYLATYKSVVKKDDYLRNIREKLICSLTLKNHEESNKDESPAKGNHEKF
jgi:hypothetical protein